MPEESVTIKGDAVLEGALNPAEGGEPRGGIVLCHPHTLHGGTMHNAVVAVTAREAARRGLTALRFNFRGAGGSGGTYDGGKGERSDLAAALAFLAERIGAEKPFALVGYSFGAVVAAGYMAARPAGELPRISSLTLIGFPANLKEYAWLSLAPLREAGVPVLVVAGEDDTIGPPEKVREAVAPLGELVEFVEVPGTDHFFVGRRHEVAGIVLDRVMKQLFPGEAEQ